jgi:CRP-like cAMP-binding protein
MQLLTPSTDTSFLGRATVFSPLPVPVLTKLLATGELRRYANGEPLFQAGEATDETYVIKSGIVEICRQEPDSGAVKVVAYLGEGDSIGEMVLFTGSPRSSLARVPEEAEIFALSRAGIIELCRQEPDLALYFCRLFATRLESWVKKGRRQDTQRQLQGNLEYFDLATVLQTLGDTQASGTLVVRTDTGRVHAELDFRDGRLRQARLGHLVAEQAFYQLFEPPPSGTFLFQGGVHLDDDAGHTIDQGVVGMLMEAMRLQDEWTVLCERYADQDRILLPAADELAWDDDASIVAAYDLWSRLHRASPLGQLVAELPYCSATVLSILDRMVATNQVR